MKGSKNRTASGSGFFVCLWQDVCYGIRILMGNPGFATIAIISLALGIGATTAIFSVYDVIWLRPLPYPHGDRLVRVSEVKLKNPANTMNVTLNTFFNWKDQCTSFEHMGLQFTVPMTMVGGERPVRIVTRQVSEEYFDVLGGKARLGRLFLPEDYELHIPLPIVLSYPLWQRQFDSDPEVIGRKVNLATAVFTVVGIMSPDYRPLYGDEIDLWFPNLKENARTGQYWQVIGLLKDGTDIRTAQAEIDVVAQGIADQYPEMKGIGARIQLLRDYLYGNWSRRFLVFFGAVVFTLLIACANVANLLLVRAVSRDKEMAVRASVGAGRPRLIRQMLTEGVLLALLGAALGLFIAFLAVKLLTGIDPGMIPRSGEIGFNLRILGFAVVLAFLSGLLFSLLPALRASKPDLTESLKETGHRSASPFGGRHAHGILVIVEIALSLVLFIGAGLMVYNIWRSMHRDVGFNTDNLVTMQINLPLSQYVDRVQGFWMRMKPGAILARQKIQEELRALPGIRSVSIADQPPLSGCKPRFVGVGSQRPPAPGSSAPVVCLHQVGPEYLRTLQVPMIKGREFSEQDNENSQPVAIVNESMVHQYFPNEDPVGKVLNLGVLAQSVGGEPPLQIVGVVADVSPNPFRSPMPAVYMPYSQLPQTFHQFSYVQRTTVSFVARTDVAPASLKKAMQQVTSDAAGDVMVQNIRTVEEMKSQFLQRSRMYTWLLVVFAGIAVTLAAVGIYGVMSYAVTQRTREIGIRMALGAGRQTVIRMVMWQGLLMISFGLIIGLAGAFGLTRFLRGLLIDVKPTDPWTFVVVSIVLCIVALVACFIPAYRAAKVNPATSLRHE